MAFPTYSGLTYHPLGLDAATSQQRLNIYIPDAPPHPDTGLYPVCVYYQAAGGVASAMPADVTANDVLPVRWQAYNDGWALIDVTVTIRDVDGEPEGNGFYLPTSDANYKKDGTGWDNPTQDAIWTIQWLREQAKRYGLDMERCFTIGTSAGVSLCAGHVAVLPDQADPTSAIPMLRQSSRVAGVAAWRTQVWWPAFIKDGLGTNIFRDATDLEAGAEFFGDAVPSHLLEASLAYWMIRVPENKNLVVHFLTDGVPGNGAAGTVDYGLEADLTPSFVGTDVVGLLDQHDAYYGIVFKQICDALGATCRLVAPLTYTEGGVTPDAIITSIQGSDAGIDAMTFFKEHLALPPVRGGGSRSSSVGARWINVSSTRAAWPRHGDGSAIHNTEQNDIASSITTIIEGVMLEDRAGASPTVTLVDQADAVVETLSFPLSAPSAPTAGDFVAVYRGVTDFGELSNTVTPLIGGTVVVANIVPRLMNFRRGDSGRTTPDTDSLNNVDFGASIQPVNTTTIGLSHDNAGENVDHRFHWEVTEYTGAGGGVNEFIVRSSTAISPADGVLTATTSAISAIVDTSRCVVFLLGLRNVRAAGSGDSFNPIAVVNADKTVTFTRANGSGSLVIRYAVVEYTGTNWSVRSFASDLVGPSGVREPVALSSSVPSWRTSFIVGTFAGRSGETSVGESGCVYLPGASGTGEVDVVMDFDTDNMASGDYAVSGWVVSNPDITVTHLNGFDGELEFMTPADQSKTYTIPAVNEATTFLIGYGISNGTGVSYPQPCVGYRLASSTTIELWRGRAGSTIRPALQVVQCRPTAQAEGVLRRFGGRRRGLQVNAAVGFKVNEIGTRAKVFYRSLS